MAARTDQGQSAVLDGTRPSCPWSCWREWNGAANSNGLDDGLDAVGCGTLLPIQIVVEVDRWTSHIMSPKSAMFQHSSLHDLTNMDLPRAYFETAVPQGHQSQRRRVGALERTHQFDNTGPHRYRDHGHRRGCRTTPQGTTGLQDCPLAFRVQRVKNRTRWPWQTTQSAARSKKSRPANRQSMPTLEIFTGSQLGYAFPRISTSPKPGRV